GREGECDPQDSRRNQRSIDAARFEREAEYRQDENAEHQHRADGLLAAHFNNDVFEHDRRDRLHRPTPTRMYAAYASRTAWSLELPSKTIFPRSMIAARVAPRRPCSRSCVVRMIVRPDAAA